MGAPAAGQALVGRKTGCQPRSHWAQGAALIFGERDQQLIDAFTAPEDTQPDDRFRHERERMFRLGLPGSVRGLLRSRGRRERPAVASGELDLVYREVGLDEDRLAERAGVIEERDSDRRSLAGRPTP